MCINKKKIQQLKVEIVFADASHHTSCWTQNVSTSTRPKAPTSKELIGINVLIAIDCEYIGTRAIERIRNYHSKGMYFFRFRLYFCTQHAFFILSGNCSNRTAYNVQQLNSYTCLRSTSRHQLQPQCCVCCLRTAKRADDFAILLRTAKLPSRFLFLKCNAVTKRLVPSSI